MFKSINFLFLTIPFPLISGNGIVKNKKLIDLNNMNDVRYLKNTTEKDFKNNNFFYGVLTSLREKINAPAKNRRK